MFTKETTLNLCSASDIFSLRKIKTNTPISDIICYNLPIFIIMLICHYFLPPSRKGSHDKSDYTCTFNKHSHLSPKFHSFDTLPPVLLKSILLFHSTLPTKALSCRQLYLCSLHWHLSHSVSDQNTPPTSSSPLQQYAKIWPFASFTISSFARFSSFPQIFLFPPQSLSVSPVHHSLRNLNCLLVVSYCRSVM